MGAEARHYSKYRFYTILSIYEGRVYLRKKRGFIQLAILHLLKEETMNGYQLMKELEIRSDDHYKASSGTIYPALNDLLQKEWIILNDEEKKTYTLTEEGLEVLTKRSADINEDFWSHWKKHMAWKKSTNAQLMKEALDELNDYIGPIIKHGHEHPKRIEKLTKEIIQFTKMIKKEV